MSDSILIPKFPRRPRVVVIGGGFAGIRAVRGLRKAAVDITLVDRRNFHLFQPLLYQVATGGLSPANIATPLRSILRRQTNCEVVLGEAREIDAVNKTVLLDVGIFPFDTLVIAGGVTHSYFGHDEWESAAPGLKTVEDATSIRSHILEAFEKAERTESQSERDRLLTFVVIGGGPTGVELAGTLIEIARHTLKADFRRINPANARVILIEAGERILPAFSPDLSDRARSSLSSLGVDVQTRTRVTEVASGQVTIAKDSGPSTIFAETILWAAGVKGSALGKAVQKATGVELDRAGRVVVEPDFSVPGQPDIFVIGDLASYRHSGEPLPGVAPAAMQAGDYVARVISARLQNRAQPVFHYRDKGSMATIGRAAAVASVGGWKFSGLPAWLLWLFIHLLYLVQFQNRLLVLIQWAWNYMTYNRSARLITATEHRASAEISNEAGQDRLENRRINLPNKLS